MEATKIKQRKFFKKGTYSPARLDEDEVWFSEHQKHAERMQEKNKSLKLVSEKILDLVIRY